MQPRGFEDKQAPYAANDPRTLIGQIRRLGEAGPAYLFRAVDEVRSLEWFGKCVKSFRAFRMEQGSDFTAVVKGE